MVHRRTGDSEPAGSGPIPKKSDLVNFRGPDSRKFSELCVLLCFLGKTDKMLPKSRFSKLIFGHSAGSTELDRPYCKRFWEIKENIICKNLRSPVETALWNCRLLSPVVFEPVLTNPRIEKAPASYRAVSGPSGPKPQKSQKRVSCALRSQRSKKSK